MWLTSDTTLLDDVIEAHGGRDRWSRIDRVVVRLRIRGNIFALKFAPTRTRALEVSVDTRRVHAVLRPFPLPGLIGEFETDRVSIRADDGRVVSGREIARDADGRVSRKFRWD